MKKFFSFAIFLLVSNFLFTSIHAQCPNPGGSESDFGDDVWKVNVYELGISYDTTSSWLPEYYSGFYNDSSLNFDSRDKWDDNSDPTTAPGYTGCEIPYPDYMSWSAKREGFPCGIYRIDIINHDDYADLFIDGVRVWGEESLNSNTVVNAWTGTLNSFSKVEFRIAEDEGFTNGALSFTYLGSTGSFIDVTGHPLVCTGQSYTLTSTITGASYGWSNGETTNPAHGSESGSYFVTVTDDDGCPVTADPVNISVLPDAAPVAHITSSANSTCYWETVSLSSDSTSGNLWSTTATTQGISVNIPDDYVLTVTNNAGCFDQATAHITGGSAPSPPPVNSTMGVCPGSIVHLDAGGLAPGGKTASFNNVWVQVVQDIPENDFTIEMWVKTTELTTGFFSARNFSTGWDRDLYLNNGQLYAQVAGGHILNSGISINDGKWHHIALTVETGVGTRIYVDGGLAPNTDPYDHADVNQDAFYLGYSLPAGGSSNLFEGEMDNVRIWSEARSENDIRNNMTLETPLSSTNLVYHCTLNGNIHAALGNDGLAFTSFGPLNFPDADYYTYTWTGDGAPPPSSSEIIMVPAQDGIYSVTATAANNCEASPAATITVAVASAIPVSHINTSSPSICDGNPVALSSDSTTGNSWSTNETTQTINVSEAGDYQLVVTNGGCSDSSSIHIGNGFTPPAPVASNSGPVCQNSSVDLIASGLAPGGSVARFNGVVGDLVYVEQDIPETDFTVEMWVKTSAAQTGIFSATNGFGQDDRDLYLVNGQLHVRLTSVNSFNSGVTINDNVWHHIALTVESGVGLKVYVDGDLAPNTSTYDHSDFTFQNGFTLGRSYAASYPFTLNGDMDNVRIWSEPRSQADIRNNMLLETPSSVTNLIYLCTLNGNTQATIGNNPSFENGVSYVNPDYYTYTWTGEGAPASSANEIQSTSALSANGIYYVTASVNGCPPSVSASTMVTVTPAMSYYADVDEDGYGDANVLVQTCDAAPDGYITNHTDCNDGNGAVHPGVTDVCNGLDDNCDNVVDENAILATTTPSSDINVCKATPVTFTANSGSGISYQWMKNGADVSGATNISYTTKKAASYQVRETNSFGCSSISAAVSLTTKPQPVSVITALGDLNICNTGSVTLQANSGGQLTYQWTKGNDAIAGATNQTYTTNKKGNFHCMVTNNKGCSKKSNSLVVTKDCGLKKGDVNAITADLSLYPNPTTGRFIVDLKSDSGENAECKVMVMNMVGQIIYAADASMIDGELQHEISLSPGIAGGMYLVRVIMNDDFYEGKLIVQY